MHAPLSSRRTPALSLLALIAALAAVFAPQVAVHAAENPAEPAIRWAVSPADADGADGRTSIQHTLDPGETVEDHFVVRNVSAVDATFRLAAADGYYTRTGRFDMLPSDRESVDAGTWISVPDDVSVPAGGAVVVPFTLTVPDGAEPGDHAAGITASVLTVQTAEGATSIGVESRVGFRVTTRVTGELTPAAAITGVSTDYDLSWNPVRAGSLTATVHVQNTGNTRILAAGTVEVAGRSVAFPAEGVPAQELLPGDARDIPVVIDDVWPTVALFVHAQLTPSALAMDGSTPEVAPTSLDVVAWAIPWPQLAVLAGLALVVGAILWGRRRSRRRLATMLEGAREEGRRSAVLIGEEAL